MDSEFLALSFVFIFLGVAGIVLFSGPLTPSGDSCYCIISTPEPGAAQGTSSIFLALGAMFFPMALMKGGAPSFRRVPGVKVPIQLPGGRVVTPVLIVSGNFFVVGILLLLVGIDAVLVPAYLVFKNVWYELAGALLTAAGALATAWGLKKPKSA